MIDWISVDHNFIKTMEIKLIKGRDFSDEFSTDKHFAYILNESAAKQIGWKDPLAGKMDIIGWGPVIGVIKDFNFQSLHQQIVPMALCIFPEIYNYMLIRIKKEDVPGSIRFLEDKWKEVYPGRNFEYSFFDKDFDKLYKSEIVFGRIINFITSLALIVACLGLLGLVHFSTERRSKEIGIRKVAGASVMNILILITKDFIKWIIIANIIAVPVVYYIMNKWLQDFAYRINIDWLTFVLAGITTLVIALAAISFRSVKAARLNPVDSLKYE
jgi:putative ABC transport system permease protein